LAFGLKAFPAGKATLSADEESKRHLFDDRVPLKTAIVGSYLVLFCTKYLIFGPFEDFLYSFMVSSHDLLLSVAHELSTHGIFHRDLSWKNVFPTLEGLLVGDFNRLKRSGHDSAVPSKMFDRHILVRQIRMRKKSSLTFLLDFHRPTKVLTPHH
jgi:hypothetical protein